MAAGELGVWLTLRGRGEMVAGLKEVSSGVRTLTRGLKETGAQAVVTDAEMAKVYSGRHVAGLRGLGREVSSLHMGLGRLVSPITGIARGFGPLIGLAGVGGLVAGLHAGVQEATKLQTAMGQLRTEAGVKAANIPGLTAGARTIAAQTGVRASTVAGNELYHLEGSFNKQGKPLSNTDALHFAEVISQTSQIDRSANVDDVAKAFAGLRVTGVAGASGSPEALAGKLLAIVGAGGTMRMGDLASAVGTGKVPGLAGLGLNLDQIGGLLATATDNNREASSATLDLYTSLMHVQRPTASGVKAMAAIGIHNPLQLAGDLRKPGSDVTMFEDLTKHLDTLAGGRKGVMAQAAIAAIFGGSKGSAPIELYINQLDRVKENTDAVSKSTAATFRAAWDVASKTYAVQKDRLVETARDAASGIGAAMLPTLGRVTGSLATVITDFSQGHTTDALKALGLSGPSLGYVQTALSDIRGIVKDTGKIFSESVVPGLRTAGAVFGGAVGVGLHLLKDVTGFLADHATTTKVLLDSIIAVLTIKTVGSGLAMLAALPARLGASAARTVSGVGGTVSGLTSPIAGFRSGYNGGAAGAGAGPGAGAPDETGAAGGSRFFTAGKVAVGAGGGLVAGFGAGQIDNPYLAAATGALGGAAIGAAGGPAGAAIGAAVGGLTALATSAWRSANALSDQSKVASSTFGQAKLDTKTLAGALGTDMQGKAGFGGPALQQALASVLGNLSDTTAPGLLGDLTKYGVSVTDIISAAKGDAGAVTKLDNVGQQLPANEQSALGSVSDTLLSAVDLLNQNVRLLGGSAPLFVSSSTIPLPGGGARDLPGVMPALPGDTAGLVTFPAPRSGGLKARASGGPVGVGTLYQVNELGTELFAPSRPGTVIPANTSAAMAGAAAARGQGLTWTGDLVINPTPGMDERALAKAAVAEMVRVISDTAARH